MEMQTDTAMKNSAPPATEAASLVDLGLRRPSVSAGKKDGDITAELAAMPASPEILSDYERIAPEAGPEMRDVTPSMPDDIVAWWKGLKSSRKMPSRDCLRASDIAAQWPNLILFRRGNLPGQLLPDNAFATALRANGAGQHAGLPGGPEITAMLSQWMIRIANKALATGAPIRDESRFDTAAGGVAFRLDALPFGADSGPDHILCQVQSR